MRALLILLLFAAAATPAEPIDWASAFDGKPRAGVHEESDASSKARVCKTCGPLCECGPGCQCTADAWKDHCKAVPPEHRAAYLRYLQRQQQNVPAVTYRPFPDNSGMRGTIVPGAGRANTSSRASTGMERMPMYALPAGNGGCTSGG